MIPQPFFKNIPKPKPGNVLEMGLHQFLQKYVSDQREEMYFCCPIFIRWQKLQFYGLGSEIFQIEKKSSVFSHSISKKIP